MHRRSVSFPDLERRQEALAAPRYDTRLAEAMPPTLVQTGEYDTLAPEGAEPARMLGDAGVPTVYRQHERADHGSYSSRPAERVSSMLAEITTFFRAHLNAHRQGGGGGFDGTVRVRAAEPEPCGWCGTARPAVERCPAPG